MLLGCCLGAGSLGLVSGWVPGCRVWDVGPGLGVWVLGCLGAGLLGCWVGVRVLAGSGLLPGCRAGWVPGCWCVCLGVS